MCGPGQALFNLESLSGSYFSFPHKLWWHHSGGGGGTHLSMPFHEKGHRLNDCLSLSINASVLSWDLSLALEARAASFEPLKEFKLTWWLLSLSRELQTLIHSSCILCIWSSYRLLLFWWLFTLDLSYLMDRKGFMFSHIHRERARSFQCQRDPLFVAQTSKRWDWAYAVSHSLCDGSECGGLQHRQDSQGTPTWCACSFHQIAWQFYSVQVGYCGDVFATAGRGISYFDAMLLT